MIRHRLTAAKIDERAQLDVPADVVTEEIDDVKALEFAFPPRIDVLVAHPAGRIAGVLEASGLHRPTRAVVGNLMPADAADPLAALRLLVEVEDDAAHRQDVIGVFADDLELAVV